ncbi:hypothetical protein LMG27952_06184 [Paraburkholderia hiiakae]|uniref:Uncharacterized protein n=1 Tax=Paraburkholderia hiiakae TaxID=1081782 RepID=A0ABM8P5C4_9BURK|nr:hypothetical protein [Paraburkholderia hiiakae]CAD6556748.1 hypothetical protein LMG27952_06184 [Paraburkholderia hiiakae]
MQSRFRLYRYVLAIVALALAAGLPVAGHAQQLVREMQLGDVVDVYVTKPCSQMGAISQYQLHVDGAPTGITAQGCRKLTADEARIVGKDDVASLSFLLHLYGDAGQQGGLTPENSVAWHTLVALPWDGQNFGRVRLMNASVVDKDGNELAAEDSKFRFVWAPIWKIGVGLGAIAVVIFLFVWLGAQTALLRDTGANTSVPYEQRTYSLARTQMAWWTLIIVASYIYIWIATGTQPEFTAQAISLLGLNALVSGASRTVDLSRGTAFPPRMAQFFFDLVSDESGVAIHRLQMLIFTVVVGANFLYQVIVAVAMPTLDPTTLALIGVSGATYVGFKTKEPQPKQDAGPGTASGGGDQAADYDAKGGYSTGDATA